MEGIFPLQILSARIRRNVVGIYGSKQSGSVSGPAASKDKSGPTGFESFDFVSLGV